MGDFDPDSLPPIVLEAAMDNLASLWVCGISREDVPGSTVLFGPFESEADAYTFGVAAVGRATERGMENVAAQPIRVLPTSI